jgi:hypothetical protein
MRWAFVAGFTLPGKRGDGLKFLGTLKAYPKGILQPV